jgi:hypothetical protein
VLRRFAIVLALASALDVVVNGASLAERPTISPTLTVPSAVVGIGQIAFEVVARGRSVHRGCALFADTPSSSRDPVLSQAVKALRTDPTYEAVLIERSRATLEPVRGVEAPFPVGIAFFGDHGRYVEGVELAPCATATCASPEPPRPSRYAALAPSGHLGPLGVGPGATLVVLGACGLGASA